MKIFILICFICFGNASFGQCLKHYKSEHIDSIGYSYFKPSKNEIVFLSYLGPKPRITLLIVDSGSTCIVQIKNGGQRCKKANKKKRLGIDVFIGHLSSIKCDTGFVVDRNPHRYCYYYGLISNNGDISRYECAWFAMDRKYSDFINRFLRYSN